jgi:hypothetical protein
MKLFGGNERLRAAVRSRARLTHGTAVAYLALFLALGGSGYAATRLGGHSKGGPVAQAARGSKLKVHCTATNGGKRVKCVAVTGVVRGPQGPQGPKGSQGPPGKNGNSTTGGGTSGNTVLTQAPAYAGSSVTATTCSGLDSGGRFGSVAVSSWEQTQSWSATSNCATGNGEPPTSTLYKETGIAYTDNEVFLTYLLSPSEVDGSATHLASVQFCYGVGGTTAGSGSEAQTDTMTITRANVYEIDEPAAASAGTGAPPYKHELLADKTFSLSSGNNCATLKPPTPAAIDSAGYLLFQVFVTFHASAGYWPSTAGQVNTAAGHLTLGRITTTYSP